MSFRGRYPSKFRRSGNFRGHERPAFRERGRPFKRKYHEDRVSPQLERIREHVPIRGRGRQVEREKDYSDRGRGRPFKKHFSDRGLRPPRSRGRYFRGRQGHFRGRPSRGKIFESPREFDHERSYERHESPGYLPEENEFVEDERCFDRRANASDEWYEGEEGDEYYNSEEDHIIFERRLRSPLTIHRRFDHSPERSSERSRSRSRSRLRRSLSLDRRHFSDEREHSFERLRSPLERRGSFERRRDSIELRRSLSIERRDNFTGYRRSHIIDRRERFVGHQRSDSPEEREQREERKRSIDLNRHSFERSPSPPREYRSRERFFRDGERERSIAGSSRRSLERQIAFEKERLQQMLEHEKKIHEKRSESSIERFLDDCKRSFENNTKSHSISRSSSFDRRDYRRNKRSLERSLSPLDQSRTFKGLENITIERGRSLERSNSPIRRPKNYKKTDEFSPERQRSPFWREDFRQMHENNSDSGRRSRSSEYHERRYSLPRNLSPEVTFDRKSALSNNSPSRAFRDRPNFLGQRERPFLEEREGPFLEEREGPFLEERERPFSEEQERALFENRKLGGTEDGTVRRRSAFDTRERSLERSSPQGFKRRGHFLGAGDGPFSENRSISKDHKENDNHNRKQHNMSPISQGGSLGVNERATSRAEISAGLKYSSFDKKELSKTKGLRKSLELSPVSQSGSFEKREFSDYHEACADNRMDLSPISQTGSFEKREFSQGNKTDQELSPISQDESFGKEKCSNKSVKINTERPSSTDSMQKFLAELENDDISRSSSEKCHLQEKVHDLKNADTQCIPVQKDVRLMRSLNDPVDPNRFNTFSSASISKEKPEDIPHKSSYYDFKFTYDSLLNKKPDKPFNENNQKEELFNAYEKTFLNQTCDAYNEKLFQGRYEQSSKIQGKSNWSKMDVHLPFTQKTPIPQLHFNKTSELSTPSMAQQISSRPLHNQSYDNNYREIPPSVKPGNQYLPNQSPQNTNPLFSGSIIRPNKTSFFPNQAIRPIYSFQQMPSTLPIIPPVPFQQNTLPSNQNTHILQPPKEFIENILGNPMFSQRVDKVSGQQPVNWKNQSTEFHKNSGESKHSLYSNQFQQNSFNNLNPSLFPAQTSQNEHFPPNSISQTGNQTCHVAPKKIYNISNLHHSEKLNQDGHLPQYSLENQNYSRLKPWSAVSGPNQQLSNKAHGGDLRKKVPIQHNVKEVIVISDDEGHNKKYDDNSDDDLVFISDGIVIPTAKTVEKYKNCSPTYDVLGKILKGFVIYYGVKENSELQKDPIEVLQESFTSSEGFERLDIEEKSEYKPSSQFKQVCELRWKGLLLSRGEGGSREEARQVAGIALINALAKTCYTIQTKYGYYNNGKYPKFMLKHPEKPGYYKMVKRDEIIKSVTETVKQLRAQGFARGVDATHVSAVISFMDEVFQDQKTHCELIFGPSSGMEYTIGELKTIARHATENGLQYRWFHGTKKVKVMGQFLCVSRCFSPQALQRYLLVEMGDTVRYRLFPPQGPKIDLLTTGNFYSPNMIKTILPLIGPDGKLRSDVDNSMDEVYHEDSNTRQEPNQSNQGMNQSNQLGSGWRNSGPTNIQPHQNTYPQFQSPGQNPNPRFQGPSRPFNSNHSFQNTNPQNKGFDQSFQGSAPGVSNPFMQGGFKRNDPFQGGYGGKRGKWA